VSLKDFTLARLKTIAAVLGGILTIALQLDWGVDLPTWVTALSTLLTAVAVYKVPNIGYKDPVYGSHALLDDNGKPVIA
jgi:hypothetical protein